MASFDFNDPNTTKALEDWMIGLIEAKDFAAQSDLAKTINLDDSLVNGLTNEFSDLITNPNSTKDPLTGDLMTNVVTQLGKDPQFQAGLAQRTQLDNYFRETDLAEVIVDSLRVLGNLNAMEKLKTDPGVFDNFSNFSTGKYWNHRGVVTLFTAHETGGQTVFIRTDVGGMISDLVSGQVQVVLASGEKKKETEDVDGRLEQSALRDSIEEYDIEWRKESTDHSPENVVMYAGPGYKEGWTVFDAKETQWRNIPISSITNNNTLSWTT